MLEHLKKLLIVPPLALALVVANWMVQQEAIAQSPRPEAGIPVRIAIASQRDFAVQASGFGRAEASTAWSAVSEVEGRITRFSPKLQTGARVREGDLLFEIDARDYEITFAQREADVLSAEAELAKVDVNAGNTKASLEVEREVLELYRQERERLTSLAQGGGISQTDLDSAVRSHLNQKSVVTDLETTLALVAPDRLLAEASLAKAKADLESARRDLERTKVNAPFDGRVTLRGADLREYIRVGDTVISLEDTAASEIEASFQLSDLGQLFGSFDTTQFAGDFAAGVLSGRLDELFDGQIQARAISRLGADTAFEWPGKLVRFTEAVDEDSGTIGVVVRVESAGSPDADTGRPPLVNGSFLEIELTAPSAPDTLMIPLEAVRGDSTAASFAYVMDAEDRLERRTITLGPNDGIEVVVLSGLAPGERVVLSDPQPAILGALLSAVDPVTSQAAGQ